MILRLIALLVPMIFLFVADVPTFLATSLWFYGLLLCWRWFRRENASMELIMFGVYGLLFGIMVFGNVQRFVPYTGSFIYGALALLSLVGSFTTPWTLPRAQAGDPVARRSHRLGNIILLICNALAMTLSILLFPGQYYIILPLGLSLISIPLSILVRRMALPRKI